MKLTKIMIAKAASLTKCAGGPSHLGADQFCHMLLSKKFKAEAKEMRERIAVLARTLASTLVNLKSIKALTICRLIPLNKNPGVGPIPSRHAIFRKYLLSPPSTLQCSGHPGNI